VSWADGWPLILKQGETIPYRPAVPKMSTIPAVAAAIPGKLPPSPLTGNFNWRDEFSSQELDIQWNLLREFDQSWLKLDDNKLQIQAKPTGLDSMLQPAFVSRRQQHMHYESSTQLQVPAAGISAGMVAFQNEQYHYYLGVRQQADQTQVFLEQAAGAAPKQLLSQNLPAAASVKLKISGQAGQISFYYAVDNGEWQALGPVQDGKLLSTQVATGFVGTMLGLYSRQESPASQPGTGE
jgi:alpha-N-arabinofuranosidase